MTTMGPLPLAEAAVPSALSITVEPSDGYNPYIAVGHGDVGRCWRVRLEDSEQNASLAFLVNTKKGETERPRPSRIYAALLADEALFAMPVAQLCTRHRWSTWEAKFVLSNLARRVQFVSTVCANPSTQPRPTAAPAPQTATPAPQAVAPPAKRTRKGPTETIPPAPPQPAPSQPNVSAVLDL